MSEFFTFMSICSIIGGLIFSVIFAAILSVISAIVLKILIRLILRFQLSYFTAYVVSFLSWFATLFLSAIVSLIADKFEIIVKPGFTRNSQSYESIYPPGTMPYSTYIWIILALLVVSVIYAIKIEHPDTGPIGICKGFLVAFAHTALIIVFTVAIFGYIAFMGP